MAEKPDDKTPRGRLSSLFDWLMGAPTPPAPLPADLTETPARPLPALRGGVPVRIGHYAITHKIGQGGMGVVYAARDERLARVVALKTIASPRGDETARKRFWREARAAASVNHPNVCQLYEIGEDAGELFIAMEMLEGEALTARLKRGALSVAEALPIGLGILAALQALHARGIVHRDLKPSNVFLTPHGVKLLDFGLAQASDGEAPASLSAPSGLTRSGMVVGTPGFMSPEQVAGDVTDGRSDLFAVGAMLFEMLAGRPAFGGHNAVEVMHAVLHEQPPALTGSPAVAAVDRVIRRALAKSASDRPATADAMADELRAVRGTSGEDAPALARALTRVVVLPFRVLRPDPETDFLAFSLPDAVATSLSGLGSLVVRSSAVAARFSGETPDLKALAADADVDRVVMGTLIRSGDQLRVTAQLVEAPDGTLLTAHTAQSSMGDLFQLQDDIARRVVEALSLPLGGGPPPPTPSEPHDARAYELYLRANELARRYDQLPEARDLYARSLELDSTFAPAWARLGRCHRVIGKFLGSPADTEALAEEAFRRALELSPRLSLAHKFYAVLESDTGRAPAALLRLVGEASRHGNDPELFAGLVHACRYCGLFEHALAAHDEARRLDPNVPTSLEQTLLLCGDLDRLLAGDRLRVPGGGDEGIRVIALGLAGRRDEARQELARMREASHLPAFREWTGYLLAWLDRKPAEMVHRMTGLGPLKIMDDPEAMFQEGWLLCDVGEHARGLPHLQRAVAKGYFVAATLAERPQFDALRDDPAFQRLQAEAAAAREQALGQLRAAGGERVLGL